MVKFYVLDRRLEQDVTEMSDRSPVERKTMLICSILDISSTEITDKLLEKCRVLETAHNLDLYCIEILMVYGRPRIGDGL